MIRVHKPARAPGILLTAGVERRAQHVAEYLAEPTAFIKGDNRFEFDRDVYADTSVKDALRKAQYDKCCFCEAKIGHVSAGDIEHFRPKAAIRQSRAAPLSRPGYYWLAYEWSNLYYACQLCNQRNKQNLFPLEEPSGRARAHDDDRAIINERPLFIDPGIDEPEQLIGFRDGEPYPIDDNPRARSTIISLELGRKLLMERRDEKIRVLGILLKIVEGFRDGTITGVAASSDVEAAATVLAKRTEAHSEFASAVRYMLRDQLGPGLRFPLTAAELIAYAHGLGLPTVSPQNM